MPGTVLAKHGAAWHNRPAGGAMNRITSVILDRDGTLIKDKHYLADPAGVELLPGATTGLTRLAGAGMRLFVVTNQSGIGRGYFTEEEYHACHAAMEAQLRDAGISLTGTAFCPHGPDEGCACRKPEQGMWRALAAAHGIESAATVMVGDKEEDILFGKRAAFFATVLVLTGKGRDTATRLNLPVPEEGEDCREVDEALFSGVAGAPHAVARDLDGAARWILKIAGTR